MTAHVRVGGVFKDVNEVYTRVGGAWKSVEQAWTRVGGVWREWFKKGGPFIAQGAAGLEITSPDGVTWTIIRTNGGFSNLLVFGDGIFLKGGFSGNFKTSPDGITYTNRTWLNANGELASGVYGDRWVLGAQEQFGAFRTAFTTNFTTYTTIEFAGSIGYPVILFVNGVYYFCGTAGGGPRIMSAPASSLTTLTFRNAPFNAQTPILAAAHAAGVFVVVAGNGEICTSSDGITFTNRPNPQQASGGSLGGVDFGNNIWVAAGFNNRIISSPNAITWTLRTTPVGFSGNQIAAVKFGSGIFVLSNFAGDVASSPNGINWTRRTYGTQSELRDIAFKE